MWISGQPQRAGTPRVSSSRRRADALAHGKARPPHLSISSFDRRRRIKRKTPSVTIYEIRAAPITSHNNEDSPIVTRHGRARSSSTGSRHTRQAPPHPRLKQYDAATYARSVAEELLQKGRGLLRTRRAKADGVVTLMLAAARAVLDGELILVGSAARLEGGGRGRVHRL